MNSRKVLLGLAVIAMFAVPVAMACGGNACRGRQVLRLLQKDPDTWEPVPGGAYVDLIGVNGRVLQAHGQGLEPKTSYTLIYYGNPGLGINDVWPHATCIGTKQSNGAGRINFAARVPYCDSLMELMGDGIPQKFWLVPSSDVDCDAQQMTAWNPEDILFETMAI